MPFVLDGHNLMHEQGLASAPDGARQLVDRVRSYLRSRGGRCHVFFDGVPSGGFAADTDLGEIKVLFSGSRKADDAILHHLRASAQVRNVTVVTSDRALASSCRALGADIRSGREFFSLPARPAARPGRGAPSEKPTHVDVREWEEFFAREPNDREADEP